MQIPCSRCSKSCLPGFRRVLKEGMQVCCYDCVKCAEGEISTLPDMENCVKCSEDQWSNKERNKCIMKAINFLSFEDPLGIALTSTSVFLSVYTLATLCLFLKHHNSTIVKANNQELSYTILISLILSLLGSLLFIGRPRKVTCLLRQAAFGIIFSICISSVLGKAMTVLIAFSATKPGSKLSRWVGNRIPRCTVLFCSLIELLICICWLINSPPFPDYDNSLQTSYIILHCNEGSPIALFCIVGFIASLAFVSFFIAYLGRKLPDIFNEAQHITFSMLVFCSVWITFIPTYLSTKGKYATAVEIFAILASNLGLLGFIFVPKCYVILIKPDMYKKSHIMSSKSKFIK
ncbi:vomeronasal type-2 receptor 26-like [Mixophyes fleayi]|uniref:vomeronasal type-2 receptor 26-like n=1 Tax=Mixophyes fleayi TaxID=3061075 RepID=UPI003F4DDCDC